MAKINFNDVYKIFDGVKMLFTFIFPFLLHVIQSSIVNDGSKQQGIYISDYCPKMKYCAEGTHVMCMYYNPNNVYGPLCSNPKNITITPMLAEKLLEVVNTIRSKIARGTEKGKNGELLPRGYGIFRLTWDTELATFAQVLANGCVLKHDMCRATKRFPDPGQTIGKARFSYPDWFLISSNTNFSMPGLSDDKLLYTITVALKTWYGRKNYVDKEMISNCPDWVQNPSTLNERLYLEMIYGSATRMGCGISAYTEYSSYGPAGKIYNSVQIVCNFSAKPRTGTAVYNTVPPGDTEAPISRCGCPYGSKGDNECLCVTKDDEKELSLSNCNDGFCDPTVVVLPIFTMEDTSPDHIFSSFTNNSVDKSTDIGDNIFGHLRENNFLRDANNKNSNSQITHSNIFTNNSVDKSTDIGDSIFGHLRENNFLRNAKNKNSNGQMTHSNTLQQTDKKVSVRKRNFDKKEIDTNPVVDTSYRRQSLRMPSKHVQKKSSIFTRASRFSLPTTRNNKQSSSIYPIKKDVVPRKDFSNGKKLVDKYINYGKSSLFNPIVRKSFHHTENDIHNTENGNDHHEIMKPYSGEDVLHVSDHTSRHHTESSLSLIEQNVVHHNDFNKDLLKDSIFNYNEPIQSISATTDNKLMDLLDTLEIEVKHIELRDKDKELFDEKIRKIYGKVVGKPVDDLGIKLTMPDKYERKNELDDHLEKLNKRMFTGHPDILEKHKLHKDKTDLSSELYDDPTAVNHHNIQRKSRDRSLYHNNDIENIYRHKNGYRNIEHNGIESHENKYDDFDFNYRKDPYKREHYSRKSMPRHDNRDDNKSSHKNYYLNRDGDPLSMERRKYYQDKLNNIERRINRVRNHKRRTVTDDHHMRAMLTPHARKSENKMDSFYIPDRARFLHGY